jgi:hypothetical protein
MYLHTAIQSERCQTQRISKTATDLTGCGIIKVRERLHFEFSPLRLDMLPHLEIFTLTSGPSGPRGPGSPFGPGGP